MIAGTHVAFATALYLGGAALFEYQPDLIGWGLAASCALLPDIDLPTSKFGRVLFWISTRLERRFGHRTLTHSFIGVLMVALLTAPLHLIGLGVYGWAIIGGYWSHLWIDMFNVRGIDLFWPSAMRVVMPGNKDHRILAGSKPEMILLICLLAFSALLYPVSGMGFRTGLAHLLGNFDMAREQYVKHVGQHWYRLKLEATDNLTLERISGEFPVVGIWKNGLIVLQGEGLRAVGENLDAHNLYPNHVELVTGEPLRVVGQRINMRGRTLGWLLKQLDQNRTCYLSGELRMGDQKAAPLQDLDRYRPALFSGQVLRLHYARADDLTAYLDMVAAEGEVFMQVWLKSGDPAVELRVNEVEKTDAIPAQLKGFL
ncbi:metal-dependent hydrolase [Chromatium weissei]|nr:metal-dependent hydrolase [Chromatium weissei]